MNRLTCLFVFMSLFATAGMAQKAWISGTLVEKETKETLAGVKIYQNHLLLTVTDANGAFTIAFEKGAHNLYAQMHSSKTLINIQVSDIGSYNLGIIPLDIEDEGAGLKKSFQLSKTSKYIVSSN